LGYRSRTSQKTQRPGTGPVIDGRSDSRPNSPIFQCGTVASKGVVFHFGWKRSRLFSHFSKKVLATIM
jgi:hypothetical protein